MASVDAPDPEELIACPYDKVHMILHKRMQYHLMKCRKQHPNAPLGRCPFNAKHHVTKVELPFHMTTCPERNIIMPSVLHNQDTQSRVISEQEAPKYENESSENWENETVNTYFNLCSSAGGVNAYTRPRDVVRAPREVSETLRHTLPPGATYVAPQPNGAFPNSLVGNMSRLALSQPMQQPVGRSRLLAELQPQSTAGYGRGQLPVVNQQRPGPSPASTNTTNARSSPANQVQARTASTTAAFGLASLAPANRMTAGRGQQSGSQSAGSGSQPAGSGQSGSQPPGYGQSPQTGSYVYAQPGTSPNRSDDEEDGIFDPVKLRRRLQKKLKQIDQLEKAQQEGQSLEANQMKKIASKAMLLQKLYDLQ